METILEMRGVEFSWNGEFSLCINEFHMERGDRVFLKGPSGSGKTTFLGLLTGVLTPQRGDVHLLGKQFSALSLAGRDRLRGHHIGYIFQMFNLIPYLSVSENILLPCHFSGIRKRNVLHKYGSYEKGVKDLLNKLGLSYTAYKNKKVTELSRGQSQRVAAARALIGDPELIVADEPTSSLDSEHRDLFLSLLTSHCESSSLIYVSHDHSCRDLFQKEVSIKTFHPRGQA